MGKNIVICCDGTGNEVEANLSNVLKLFRIVERSNAQRVYYNPGVGTIGVYDSWARLKGNLKTVFGLATGYGLDDDILGCYRFLSTHYEPGDEIFLFGFSRGAYTVRALAGFLYLVGLLPPEQLNIAHYALAAYKRAAEENKLDIASDFRRVTGGRRVPIKFIGAWDTVASMIVPRRDRLLPTLLTLPYTRKNPGVKVFRHAMAIDERRRLFRLNRWIPSQVFQLNPFDTATPAVAQDIKQVWFAGVHSDVGGGYPESESGLAKYPLGWMIDEAVAHGLRIRNDLKEYLVAGAPRFGRSSPYVKPDPTGSLHDSLTMGWRPLEWIPKAVRWREWPRPVALGFYIPDGEPRLIASPTDKPRLHQSVVDRMAAMPSYKPVNLPEAWDVEPWS